MTVIKIQDDAGNWVPINQVIKSAPDPSIINTPTYNIPASGGDFWVDTVAAGDAVNAVLPLAPANNTIVSTQIVDNGTNDLFWTPTAPDVMGFSAAGLSGKYSGTTRNLIETLKYVSGRWLPYYGRLVYQVLVDAAFGIVDYTFVSNGDSEGIIAKHQGEFIVTASSVYTLNGYGLFNAFARPRLSLTTSNSHTSTDNLPNSWVQIEFKGLLYPSHFWLQTDNIGTVEQLRSFKIQFSLDAITWTDAFVVVNSSAYLTPGSYVSASISGVPPSRYCRVVQTGPNSAGGNYLIFCGLELYGRYLPDTLVDTVFQVVFEGADNSTNFTELRNNPISIRSGTPRISTAQSLFGNGSLYLDGSSSLVVPAAPSLVSGTQDFEWEIALYPTVFLAGNAQGIIEQRAAGNATPEGIFILNQTAPGLIAHETGQTVLAQARLKLNQWQVLRISRYQGVKTIYLDDVPVYVGADSINYVSVGNLIIGDMIDTAFPYSGMFQGYIQYVRKTIGISRTNGYQSGTRTFAQPPLTDADPLAAFKVLDINCDTGTIGDTKGHVITPTGSVAVSNVQKRAGSHSIALTGGHLDVAGGTDFNFGTAPYSVHAAARFTTLGTGNTTNSPDNQYVWDFTGGDTSALFYTARTIYPGLNVSNAGVVAINYNQLPVINTWYDLELAKVDTKYLLIQNNQIVRASNTAPATANLAGLRLGGISIATTASLQGFMDSISVYKGIANGSNLTHSYPLRFLARFSGGNPNDELGAVGTIVGTGHTYDAVNKRSLEASALFAGTGYISYPQIPAYDLGASGFEIAGWCKTTSVQNSITAIVAIGSNAGVFDNQSLTILTSVIGQTSVTGRNLINKISVWIGAASTSNAVVCSTTLVNDNLPHYWRVIKYIIGATAATVLIVDGKIEDVYIGAYTIAATTRPVVLGTDNFDAMNRQFKGNQDDIAIYKA